MMAKDESTWWFSRTEMSKRQLYNLQLTVVCDGEFVIRFNKIDVVNSTIRYDQKNLTRVHDRDSIQL